MFLQIQDGLASEVQLKQRTEANCGGLMRLGCISRGTQKHASNLYMSVYLKGVKGS
jgi:hypothetical protein